MINNKTKFILAMVVTLLFSVLSFSLPLNASAATNDSIYLKPNVTAWPVYDLNTGAVKAYLNPQKFGGLTYKVDDWIVKGTQAKITTDMYGQVKIKLDGDAIVTYGSTPTTSKTGDGIYLKNYVSSWPIYDINTGNVKGYLNPQKFGGLTYEALSWITKGKQAIIQTETYGKVKIKLDGDSTVVYKADYKKIPHWVGDVNGYFDMDAAVVNNAYYISVIVPNAGGSKALEFYNKVKGLGDWDYKHFFNNLGFRFDQPVKIKAQQKYYEVQVQDVGNIHYGFIGRHMFSATVLRIGGGVAQVGKSIGKALTCAVGGLQNYCDDPRDQSQINRGIDWYDTKVFK